MKEILKNNKYKKIFQKEEDIEKNINNFLYLEHKKNFRKGKYDISTVISYMYLEKVQKINIIKILEGITYNLDKNKIEEKIII